LDELLTIYDTIMDEQNKEFRRLASLQGIELPDDEEKQEDEFPTETAADRFRRYLAEKQGKTAEMPKANYGQGQGHMWV
jgi:hypothetical protein